MLNGTAKSAINCGFTVYNIN